MDKNKLKKELFDKYDIKLSNDDPLWLLMLMQKDMTSEVLKATKTAIRNNKSLGNVNLKAIVITSLVSFIVGFLIAISLSYAKITNLQYELSFSKHLSLSDVKKQKYKILNDPDQIIINGKHFFRDDIVFGYKFVGTVPELKKILFTDLEKPTEVYTVEFQK